MALIKASVVAFLIMGLTTPAMAQTEAALIADATEHYKLLHTDFQIMADKRVVDCSGGEMKVANNYTLYIGALAMSLENNLQDDTRSQVEHIMDVRVLGQIEPMASGAELELADVNLKYGCLDAADQTYRDVIHHFSGPAFQAARQQAMIGIDDVRGARVSKH